MTILLAGLLLCWSPNTEADFDHYRIMWTYRDIESWTPCPVELDPDRMCPVYTPWMWHTEDFITPQFNAACADSLGGVCYFKHPTAWDRAGNESVQPMIPDSTWIGGCP